MTWMKLSVIATAALLGACSMAPRYERPVLAVPALQGTLAEGAPADRPVTDVGAVAWRDYYRDERLRAVIEQALSNNRDLKLAALNVSRAQALYGIQRADVLPNVGISGGQNAQRLPGDLSPTGSPVISRQYTATLGVAAYELDFFGRVQSLKDAALETYLGSEDAQRSAMLSLVSEVARAWLTLGADRERAALAEKTFESRKASATLTQRSFELGAVSALDLRQVESLQAAAQVDAARFRAAAESDLNVLQFLVGAPIAPALLPNQLVDAPGTLAALPAGLSSEVLTQRPDILAAERSLRAANANIGAARAAFFPSITLTAAGGTASPHLDGLFGSGSGFWTFVPQINIPLFTAGRLSNNLTLAEIQRDAEVAQYDKAIQSAFREVSDALAERRELAQQVDGQKRLYVAASETYRLSDARYKAGVDSYLGLLDAQRTLYSAEQGLITIRLSDAINHVTLYKALGGGWQ